MSLLNRRQSHNKASPWQNMGFVDIRPVLNALGEERFGVIELAPQNTVNFFTNDSRKKAKALPKTVLTAGLHLHGAKLNLWLTDEKTERDFWEALTHALPKDSPSQVLLRRRPANLGNHYRTWQAEVAKTIQDHEMGYAFLADLLESLVYPVEDAGISQEWGGVFISGRDEEELAERLAILFATLPCDSTPCTATELSGLLVSYFNPLQTLSLENLQNGRGDPLWSPSTLLAPEEIVPPVLDFEHDSLNSGKASAFWMLAVPPAHTQGGWARPLLERAELAQTEFDIVAQLAPTQVEDSMRGVLVRRLIALDKQRQVDLETSEAEIQRHRHEVEQRLVKLNNGADSYFEIGLSVHLRGEAADFEQAVETFETVLLSENIALRRVVGQDNIMRAWKSCAPLNLNQLMRPFVLPGVGAGRLAQLFGGGHNQAKAQLPLIGLNRNANPFYFDNEAGQTTFLIGEAWQKSYDAARSLLYYLTVATHYLQNQTVCGFDLNGNWLRVAQQVEGEYIAFGGENQLHYNPLLPNDMDISSLEGAAKWVGEVSCFGQALWGLSDSETEQFASLLLEVAINHCTEQAVITAESVYRRAIQSGYLALAEKLAEMLPNALYGWLFNRETKLAQPQKPFTFFGFAETVLEQMNKPARQLYLARVLCQLNLNSDLVILDEAQSLLADPEVLTRINARIQQGGRVWSVAPRTEELLATSVGRFLLEKSNTQLIFNQNGKALETLVARLKLSNRTLHTLKLMLGGGAIIRYADGTLDSFNPLPCDYITRTMPVLSRPLVEPAAPPMPTAAPVPANEPPLIEQIPLLQAPVSLQDLFQDTTRLGA